MRYRLAPIEEYRGRENASAVLYLADVRIEVFAHSKAEVEF